MQGNEPGKQEILFEEVGDRIRDVRSAPDGTIYLLVEGENGRIVQVSPTQ